jgi:hypothetical protein
MHRPLPSRQITLSTVGYGDMVAKATGSQVFSLFYDFLGVILFAVWPAALATLHVVTASSSRTGASIWCLVPHAE